MNCKYIILITSLFAISCRSNKSVTNASANDTLPNPYETKSAVNFSHVIGWDHEQKPIAPKGFTVVKYADGFENPRWLYVLPNGDVLVAESNSNYSFFRKIGGVIIGANKSNNLKKSADRITLLRDANEDGIPEVRKKFLSNLNQLLTTGCMLLIQMKYIDIPIGKGKRKSMRKGI